MQRTPTKTARPPLSLLLASAVATVAMLALAGPAAAHSDHREDNGKRHHGKHHGKKHHKKRFHQLDGSQGGAAGTIASFDAATGKLTIALAGGDSASGFVTEDTRIDADGDCDHHGWSDDHDRDRRQLHGWDHVDGDDGDRGSTADLVPGAVVDEAFLAISGGRATFVKIELGSDSDDS